MKGCRESNINVWFPFMYFQKLNCYFQNRIVMFCLPVPTYTHISVRDLYISRIGLPILLQENMWTDPGNIKIAHRYMNVEIGTEAMQFPEKECINGIFVAVHTSDQERKSHTQLFTPLQKYTHDKPLK
jgi:hypothetical protein